MNRLPIFNCQLSIYRLLDGVTQISNWQSEIGNNSCSDRVPTATGPGRRCSVPTEKEADIMICDFQLPIVDLQAAGRRHSNQQLAIGNRQ